LNGLFLGGEKWTPGKRMPRRGAWKRSFERKKKRKNNTRLDLRDKKTSR